ncbi:hypothetical protein BDZ88DRAFT_293670 [Geranomyces variabilis]|nr:hypothetical protein BDZ88DRAFT_293670 [Geranomyces variabilis]
MRLHSLRQLVLLGSLVASVNANCQATTQDEITSFAAAWKKVSDHAKTLGSMLSVSAAGDPAQARHSSRPISDYDRYDVNGDIAKNQGGSTDFNPNVKTCLGGQAGNIVMGQDKQCSALNAACCNDASTSFAIAFTSGSTATVTTSNSVKIGVGLKVTLDVGLPGVIDEKTELSFDVEYTHTSESSNTKTLTQTATLTHVKQPAKQGCYWQAQTQLCSNSGTGTVPVYVTGTVWFAYGRAVGPAGNKHYYWGFDMDDTGITSPGDNTLQEPLDITASEYGAVQFVQLCDGGTDPGETAGNTQTASCPWPGHCQGDICQKKSDCYGDAGCYSGTCQPNQNPPASCPWTGHCQNDQCSQKSDCWGTATCNNGVCGPPAASCPWPGHCQGDSCGQKSDCWGTAQCTNGQCQPPPASCPWPGHCSGDSCDKKTDCWGTATCQTGVCLPVPDSCPWSGHCEGASCGQKSDCWGTATCNNGKCGQAPSTCPWSGHCDGDSCGQKSDCWGTATCNNGKCGAAPSTCPWSGHCDGDSCGQKSDCWGTATCNNGKCGAAPSTCPWSGHCDGDSCGQKSDCWGTATCNNGRCGAAPSTCPWPGHCAGDSCSQKSDCWGTATCNSGHCGSSFAPASADAAFTHPPKGAKLLAFTAAPANASLPFTDAPADALLPFTSVPANYSSPFTEGPVLATPARVVAGGRTASPARFGRAMVNGVMARWAD